MTTIPFGSDAGMAGFQTEAFVAAGELFSGSSPAAVSISKELAAAGAHPLGRVMSVDGSGKLIPAVLGTSEALYILAAPTVAGATSLTVPVYCAGCFNPDALTFDATYNTLAKKMAAFQHAESYKGPTNIVLKPHAYQGIVSNPHP